MVAWIFLIIFVAAYVAYAAIAGRHRHGLVRKLKSLPSSQQTWGLYLLIGLIVRPPYKFSGFHDPFFLKALILGGILGGAICWWTWSSQQMRIEEGRQLATEEEIRRNRILGGLFFICCLLTLLTPWGNKFWGEKWILFGFKIACLVAGISGFCISRINTKVSSTEQTTGPHPSLSIADIGITILFMRFLSLVGAIIFLFILIFFFIVFFRP